MLTLFLAFFPLISLFYSASTSGGVRQYVVAGKLFLYTICFSLRHACFSLSFFFFLALVALALCITEILKRIPHICPTVLHRKHHRFRGSLINLLETFSIHQFDGEDVLRPFLATHLRGKGKRKIQKSYFLKTKKK